MPASAAITNGSLVSETSPSSMLIGSSCAWAQGAATGAMAAKNVAPNSAPAKWLCMIDLPSTHRSGAACVAGTASAHRQILTKYRQAWNQNRAGNLDVVNDICCV